MEQQLFAPSGGVLGEEFDGARGDVYLCPVVPSLGKWSDSGLEVSAESPLTCPEHGSWSLVKSLGSRPLRQVRWKLCDFLPQVLIQLRGGTQPALQEKEDQEGNH